MRFFRDLSIRLKLTAVMTIATALALALAGASFLAYDLITLRMSIARNVGLMADVIGQQCTAALAFKDGKAAAELLSALQADSHIVAAGIYDANGQVLQQYVRAGGGGPGDWPVPRGTASYFAGQRLHVFRPVALDRERIGTVYVQSDLGLITERVHGYGRIALLLLPAGAVVTLLLAGFFQRVISTPIVGLARVAERISKEKDYSVRAVSHGRDELGVLIDSFNEMLSGIQLRDQELAAARDRAEEANRAKSAFLATMSHEIRTPMNGILGMTELALETELSAEQRDYLKTVRLSAESLLAVINDVLDFSKIEAGRLDLDVLDFDLRDCVEDATKTLALPAERKGLELTCEIRPEVPPYVAGDPGRLRQVALNLISNAIKFTAQGEVALQVSAESVDSDHALLHFEVRDTGIGIPIEKQGSIFEAFTQADGSDTRKYGGTGLGLTISARLVELMGGRIWVESAPGTGSTFHFTARFGVSRDSSIQAVTMGPADLLGLRVLVVDDNETNRRILREVLTNWQMKPTTVDGGRSALHAMRLAAETGRSFPLVILDAQMPDIDGFAVAEQIKNEPELAGVTIMMLSSAGQRGDAARCRELGIAAYLTKPVKQAELLQAILAALSSNANPETEAQLITRHFLRENTPSLRVLVAEDNAVNQTLAIRLLQKRGHQVVAVSNGREAVAVFSRQPFDLVLMDVQMPEMDGFEAVAAIREMEKPGQRHVPVIALTAYAMKGDRQRCLDAGMDDYVSKPIRPKELFAAIERFAPVPGASPALVSPPGLPVPAGSGLVAQGATRPAAREQPGPVIDKAALLEGVDGDQELLREMARLFVRDADSLLENIREAMENGDLKRLDRAAHKLKGALGNFDAREAFQTCVQLETMARAGDIAGIEAGYRQLEAQLAPVRTALADIANDESPIAGTPQPREACS